MNVVFVFLILLIALIIIAILIHESKILTPPDPLTTNKNISIEKQQANLAANVYLPYPTWGQPQPFPGNTGTGQCLIYTFIPGAATPAAPSYAQLNSSVRNYTIEPNTDFVCIDSDQLFASTVSHKCANPEGTSAGAGCILTVDTYDPNSSTMLRAGEFAPAGTIEGDNTIGIPGNYSSLLYTPCNPANISGNRQNSLYCIGDIGVIIPQFTPQANYQSSSNDCLAGLWNQGITGIGIYTTGMSNCDLADSTQIFRMIRYSVDNSGNLTQDDRGRLAAIVHRYTGFYLAPDVNYIPPTQQNSNYQYIFSQPNINYNPVTDNYGNTFTTSINLVLINPAYDDSRNGVYWLLQDQIYNPAINPTSVDFNAYAGVGPTGNGVYYMQENYAATFNPKNTTNANNPPNITSHFFKQTVEYCNSTNGGGTGCGGWTGPDEIPNGSSVAACLFNLLPGNSVAVQNVPIGIAPQQIVYIPDLRLIPPIPDPTGNSVTWTYLINNYSINITNNNTPILTPYRQTSSVDLRYGCMQDSADNNNRFTTLQNYNTGIQYAFQQPYRDSQFINYNLFIQQIQTGVSVNNVSNNINYSGKSNPF